MDHTQTLGRKAVEMRKWQKYINDCNKLFTSYRHFRDIKETVTK
jgi:hypothetical protein